MIRFDSDYEHELLLEEHDAHLEDMARMDDLLERSGDLCRCGRSDLWNGSVVCWVCGEIVVEWDAARHGELCAQTFPGEQR